MNSNRLAALVLLACGCNLRPAPVHLGSTAQGLDPANPPTTLGNPFPGMGVTMNEQVSLQANGGFTGNAQCVDCQFTTGIDQNTAQVIIADAGSDPLAHAGGGGITSSVNLPVLPGSGLADSFNAAMSAAQNSLDNPPSGVDNIHGTLTDINDAFEAVVSATGGTNNGVTFNQHQWVRAFRPIYSRNLESAGASLATTTTYPDPALLAETTERGARSYCAMRHAAAAAVASPSHGQNMTMLDNDLIKVLFWKIGYTHADATLMPISDKTNRWPVANATGNPYPGSQAFYIPIALGSQVAPLTGPLIPGFGELSHQLAWVTGDAEVLSAEDPVTSGKNGHFTTFYNQTYRDLEHYDVWSGNSYDGTAGISNVTLMDLGFFSVLLGANLSIESGVLEDPASALNDDIISQNESDVPWLPQETGDVLYDFFGLTPPGFSTGAWPKPRSTSMWVSAVNQSNNYSLQTGGGVFDDAIGFSPSCASETGIPTAFNQVLGGGCLLQLYPDHRTGSGSPIYDGDASHFVSTSFNPGETVRWRNDDDRSFVIRDSMDLGVNVSALGGLNLVFLKIGLTAAASLDVTTSVDTIVREEQSLVDSTELPAKSVLPPPVATARDEFLQSNLHVTPVGQNAVTFEPLTIGLEFVLDVIFAQLKWDVTILHLPQIPIVANPAIPDENARLRVGEYSDLASNDPGTPTQSHLPTAAGGGGFTTPQNFSALPETVAQCLQDDVSTGVLPNPPHGTPAPSAPYGMCFVGPLTHGLQLYRQQSDALVGSPVVSYVYANQLIADLPSDICAESALPVGFNGWDTAFAQNPGQAECLQFVTAYLCGNINGTKADSWLVNYNEQHDPTKPSWPAISHLITKGHNEENLAQDMWKGCTEAFANPPGASLSKSQATFLAQDFVHNFVDTVICNVNTGEPIDEGTGDAPNDPANCTPDPKTHQCWSFTPCYVDPVTGICDATCDRSEGSCNPVEPPTLCTPRTPGHADVSDPCPPVSRNTCPAGTVKDPRNDECVPLPDAGTPDAGCTLASTTYNYSTATCATPDAGSECPPGYEVDPLSSTFVCVPIDAGSECPPGYEVDPTSSTFVCVPIDGGNGEVDAGNGKLNDCDYGYTFNALTNECVPDDGGSGAQQADSGITGVGFPDGGLAQTGQCRAGYSFDATTGECVADADGGSSVTACSFGDVLDPATGACVPADAG